MIYDNDNIKPNFIIKSLFGDRTKYFSENEYYTQDDCNDISYFDDSPYSMEQVFNSLNTDYKVRIESGSYNFYSTLVAKTNLPEISIYGHNNPLLRLSQKNFLFTNIENVLIEKLRFEIFSFGNDGATFNFNNCNIILRNLAIATTIYKFLNIISSKLLIEDSDFGYSEIKCTSKLSVTNSPVMIKNSKNIKITLEESSLDLEGCSNIEIQSSHTINTLVLKNCSNIKFNGTLVLDAFIDSSKDITITTDKIEYLNTKDSFIVLNINTLDNLIDARSEIKFSTNTIKKSYLDKSVILGTIAGLNNTYVNNCTGDCLIDLAKVVYIDNSKLNLRTSNIVLEEKNIEEDEEE